MPTDTAIKTVRFVSFKADQRVIVQPKRVAWQRDMAGNTVGSQVMEGKEAQFKDRKFETDDPEIIEALRDNENFNTAHGWYEDHDFQRAAVDDQVAAIAEAAATANADALRALIAAEEQSDPEGGRPGVLDPAHKALERIESAEAEAKATPRKSKSGPNASTS